MAPTLGMPTLAECGGAFDVLVSHGRHDGTSRKLLDPKAWKVTIFSDDAHLAAVHHLAAESVSRHGPVLRLRVSVPLLTAPDVYHIRVVGPDGIRDRQYRAVRVVCPKPDGFRFVLFADHQIWDPSWKVSGGLRAAKGWPRWGQEDDNKAITLQEFHEIELLDPLFALHAGDLIFGLDYGREYSLFYDWWKYKRFATFQVPGNHDGYALYTVKIRGNLFRLGRAFWRCRDKLPQERSWEQVLDYLRCVYGDAKQALFSNPVHDGLESYRRVFGPLYYSFDVGRFHFVALNTYDGTRERRHSLSLWIPFRSLHIGAPATDNYGGYLSEKQLAWARSDIQRAAARGQTIVVLGHHDPRGNLKGPAYLPNAPFPTHPISEGHFEEWNYDASWDSNPLDGRGRETPTDNSGTRLLRLLARYGGYYLSGHVHEDSQTTYEPGETIRPGIVARRRLTFIRVTTAADGVRPGAYWGYRVLRARADGTLDTAPYDADAGLLSVPAGRLWATIQSTGKIPEIRLTNGLRHPMNVRLRFRLAHTPRGYRFRVLPPGAAQVHLLSATPDPNTRLATYLVEVQPTHRLEAGPLVPRTIRIQAIPDRHNQPPVPRVLLRWQGGQRVVEGPGPVVVRTCGPVSLDARASRDPGAGTVVAAAFQVWRLCPDTGSPWSVHLDPCALELQSAGWTATLRPETGKPYLARVRITDDEGATSELYFGLVSLPPCRIPSPSAADTVRVEYLVGLAVLLLAAGIPLVVWIARRRRGRARQPRPAPRPRSA